MTAHARTTDPATSHEAAASVRQNLHRLIVLAAMGTMDFGGTHRNIAAAAHVVARDHGLKVTDQSVRSRVAELVRDEKVVPVGHVRGPNGRRETLWDLTASGKVAADSCPRLLQAEANVRRAS